MVAFLSFMDHQIAALFVDPCFQGRGYGTQLLDVAINKYECDTLEVFVKNKDAFNFYIHVRFTKIGDTKEEVFGESGYNEIHKKRNASLFKLGYKRFFSNI